MVEDLVLTAKKDMADARATHNWKGKLSSSGGTGGGNVVTGYISDKGVKAVRTYPCHNPIHIFTNASILWSAFGYRTDKNVALLFHSWLINDSPWAKAGIVPKNTGPEEMFNEGFIFSDLDKTPANLLHNFLIATRMNAEWPALVNAWYTLVTEHSVDPTFTFLMLTVFMLQNTHEGHTKTFLDKESCFANQDKYDWPLDMGRATEEYVLNFCQGKPIGVSDYMFYPKALTKPVNTLWGELVEVGNAKSYVSILRKLYPVAVTKETKSDFGIYKVDTLQPKDVLSIILQEESRLLNRKAA